MTTEIELDRETLQQCGKQLKEVRKSKIGKNRSRTQIKMALDLGVSNSYLSRLENGWSLPSLDYYLRLRAVTGADLNILLDPAVRKYHSKILESNGR